MNYFLTHLVFSLDDSEGATTEFFDTKEDLMTAFHFVIDAIQDGEYWDFSCGNLDTNILENDWALSVELYFSDRYAHNRYSLFGGNIPVKAGAFSNSLF